MSFAQNPQESADGHAGPPYRGGGRGLGEQNRKRPRVGTLTSPLSRQLYPLIVRQLHHDGFLAAASAVADATGTVVPLVEEDGGRLAKLMCYGLVGERQQERDVRQFAAEEIVERHLSAAKVYVPLQLSQSWSVGRRCFKMKERFTSSSLTAVIRDITFSPDGSLVAVTGSEGLASVFSLQTVEDLSALDEVRAANRARGLDGTLTGASGAHSTATTRNATEITDLSRARQYQDHGQYSVDVARFHPSRPLLLTGDRHGDLMMHDYAHPDGHVTLKLHDNFPIRSASFHSSGDYIVYATDDTVPRLVNVKTGTVLTTPGTSASNSVVIDNQNSYARFDSRNASTENFTQDSSAAGTTQLSLGPSQSATMGATPHSAALTCAAFSPDGRTLVTSSMDGSWILYDGVSGKIICKVENAHSSVPVTSAAYSRSGQVLLTAGMDATARLWDLRRLSSGESISSGSECELMSFGDPAKCDHRSIRACFSYDESHVLCQDTTLLAVHSHCVYSGEVSYTLTTQPTFMQRAVAASPFANLVVTGADDCRLRLWTPSWLP